MRQYIIIRHSFFVILIVALASCQQKPTQGNIQDSELERIYLNPDTTIQISPSNKTRINWDSIGSVITNSEEYSPSPPTRVQLREKESVFTSKILKLDDRNFSKITPGFDGVPPPLEISVPSEGYLIQKKDTVFAADITIAEIPASLEVKMATKDEATMDLSFLGIEQELPSEYVFSSSFDSRGYLWIATYNGLAQYDGSNLKLFTEKHGLTSNLITFVFEDSKQNLWIGTFGLGVIKYDGNSFFSYGKKQGLPTLAGGIGFLEAFEDSNGNIWFGTNIGLIRYRPSNPGFKHDQFVIYSEDHGIHGDINSIQEDSSGHLWVGTTKGLKKFDGNSFIDYDFGLGSVTSMFMDSNRSIWFGSQDKGFARYQNQTFELFESLAESNLNQIAALAESPDGEILIGTQNAGFHIFDNERTQSITIPEGLTSNAITDVKVGPSGNYWISTRNGGICKFSPKSFMLDSKQQALKYDILRIYQKSNGDIWLGSKGIVKYDKNGMYRYDNGNNNDQFVSGISSEKDGDMWFSFFNGTLSKYDGVD
ncbi:MAG: two-component regulator propeller domain-containing protein, partial [Bacteroidota bacterium]